MSKYKNNKLMPNLLYRIINKDVLEAKFYKKGFIKNINELLPIFQNIIHMVDEHFDALDYADDDLNRQAIKLIREGNKEDIISFVKFYLKKDDKPLHEKNDIYYYSFKGTHYKKRMHPTLLKISQENDKVFLKILSKNSELKYLEVKHRKDPTQFIVLDIKKHRFKSEEYTVQFITKNLPDGKLALTVLDKDLNGSVIKSGMRFDFYETVGGNLGYIKK